MTQHTRNFHPNSLTFDEAARYGFVFPGARGWITPENMPALVHDAALISQAGSAVPAELTAFIDPAVIEIMTAPRNATEIFQESKKGDWTTSYDKWRTDELTGRTQPYSDLARTGASGVVSQWNVRQQYRFQTVIEYGDLEAAVSGAAKINLAASKQRAATTMLSLDANKFYLLGVDGMEIYGILNDPNLPPAVTALPSGTSGSAAWADKSTAQIYNDVLALFARLVSQSAGLLDRNARLVLALSPEMSVFLGAATDYNVSVLDMLHKYFQSLRIVTLPELSSMAAGETVFLIAPEVAGMPSATLGFGEKIRAFPLVRELSAGKQKFASSTYGGIVLMPFAFAQMTGMETV